MGPNTSHLTRPITAAVTTLAPDKVLFKTKSDRLQETVRIYQHRLTNEIGLDASNFNNVNYAAVTISGYTDISNNADDGVKINITGSSPSTPTSAAIESSCACESGTPSRSFCAMSRSISATIRLAIAK